MNDYGYRKVLIFNSGEKLFCTPYTIRRMACSVLFYVGVIIRVNDFTSVVGDSVRCYFVSSSEYVN